MIARLLVLSGSAWPQAPESRLAGEITRRLAATDLPPTAANLADYPLPLFNGPFPENGEDVPQSAWLLAQRLGLQDGLVLVSGEHHGGMPTLLKNAIDWVAFTAARQSRPLEPYRRLVVGLAGATPDGGGGRAALAQLRDVLAHLGAEVMTAQFVLPHANEAFSDRGEIIDKRESERLDGFLDLFLDHSRALARQA